jgi:hypothetical protein
VDQKEKKIKMHLAFCQLWSIFIDMAGGRAGLLTERFYILSTS